MAATVSLDADCDRCVALCCMGPAFDRSELFGFDKPAGEPCRNLDACGRCRIHAGLKDQGFGGCAAFDCHGAGPYVTHRMFAGRSWMQEQELIAPMTAAFAAVRQAHELLHMLRAAEALELPAAGKAALAAIEADLQPDGGWSLEDVSSGAVGKAVRAARERLRALKDLL